MIGSVICTAFICVILTVASVVRSQGYNGCKTSDWEYHDGTHTCFKLYKIRYSWSNAQLTCNRNWGGEDYKSQAQLARIDDEETNTFVKGVLRKTSEAWIGLKSDRRGTNFQWQGHPNEIPQFLKFATPPQRTTEVSVVITSSSWKTVPPNYGRDFICQSKAEIPRSEITCPPPVKQNGKLNQPLTCKFYFNQWRSVTWFMEATALASCSRDTRTGKSSCHDRKDGFKASIEMKSRKASLSYDGIVGRDFEVGLKCAIRTTDSKLLDTKTCDLQVYEPPSTIKCTHELTRDRLHVNCQTEKIYPEGSCTWFYKNQGHTSFRTVSTSEVKNRTSEEFYDASDGQKYFKSQCYVDLTQKGTDFKAGLMVVKVIMQPTVKAFDLSEIQDASAEHQEVVSIELPRQPVFTVNGKQVKESVTMSEDETTAVMCQVKSGKPTVLSTTLSCGFPITQGGDSQNTWAGITYKINTTAKRSMDGRDCTCWGNHITRDGEKSTLNFRVKYSASIDTFTANDRQTQLTIDVGSQVRLRCQSSGNPMPLVDILKNGNRVEDVIKNQNVLEASFQARCMDNGKYQCRARNTVKEEKYEESWDLDIHVRCLPTPCHGQNTNPSIVAGVGQEALVDICAVAYPKPNNKSYYLVREYNGVSSVYSKNKYTVEYSMQGSQEVRRVMVKFNKFETEDHGNYTLNYIMTGNIPASKLLFRLSPKGPPDCPKNVTVIAAGHTSASLSWIPGSDNGFNQTFVFSRHDASSEIEPIKKIQARGGHQMTYNLTGFSPETAYFLRLDAENQEGSVSCPGNTVNFTTGMAPKRLAGSGTSVGTIVAIVFTFIVIIFVIVGIAVFLFLRKRRNQVFHYKQASYSATGTSNGETETFGSKSEVFVSLKRRADTENQSPKTEEYERENNAYSNEEQDYTYNNVIENVYNNVGGTDEAEYANAGVHCSESPEHASLPPSPTPCAVEFESRRNDDGLIYMDVVIDPTDQRPKLKTQQVAKPKPAADEPVEYSSIDFLATAEVNTSSEEFTEDL